MNKIIGDYDGTGRNKWNFARSKDFRPDAGEEENILG